MKAVFIGSGNVATHMAKTFKAGGHTILQVWSASFENASLLANQVSATPISSLKEVSSVADVVVISVKDDAIAAVVSEIDAVDSLILHTSGATDLSVLAGFKRYGVLYPLQTFSKEKSLEFGNVPLCIEAGNPESLAILSELAGSLSNAVHLVDSSKRKVLHLAAVFACNFVNQLYALSNEILEKNSLDFNLLRPLITETAEKVQYLLPAEVQTGPAVRGDEKTLYAHLNLLQGIPELEDIYRILSDSIKKTHQ